IIMTKKEIEEKCLMCLSFLISLVISFIIFLILLLFHEPVIRSLKLSEISNYLFIIPLVIVFASLMQIMTQWFIRNNQFIMTSKATIYQSLIINSSKIGFGMVFPYATVLVVLTTCSYAVRALLMVYLARKSKPFRKPGKKVQNISLIFLAKKYKDFPLYRAPESLITGLSHGIPILMLTMLFGPASVGFYSIGRTVLSLPTQMIGNAVGDVF